jgi:hypothetical protein
LITLLRSYYAQYKPEIYLFEGQKVNDWYLFKLFDFNSQLVNFLKILYFNHNVYLIWKRSRENSSSAA